MTRRQKLEQTLARAEAELRSAVALSVGNGADRFKTSEAVDKARASCRQARAALTEFEMSEGR